MPAGNVLAAAVERLLSVQEAKTVTQLASELRPPVSPRAIRYAVRMLVESGRAKRVGRPHCHFKILAVAEPREVASEQASPAV